METGKAIFINGDVMVFQCDSVKKICYLVIILLGIAPKTIMAQQKLTIGINLTPNITKINGYNAPSKFRSAYSFGVKSLYYLNDHIFLGTGIMYRLKRDVLSFPYSQNLIDDNGNIIIEYVDYYNHEFNYHYFHVPMYMNYILPQKSQKKISVFISGGLELNYLNQIKTTVHFPEGDEVNVRRNNDIETKIGCSFNVGAGITYNIMPTLFLLIKPEYIFDFYSVNSSDLNRFHTLGFNVEMHYKIK